MADKLNLKLPIIFLLATSLVSGCTYSAPVTQSKIVNILRLPNTRQIFVLVQRTTLKQPEGLAAFPDGGKAQVLGIEVIIYAFDIDKPLLTMLLKFKNPPDQVVSFESWLKGWSDGDLYFQTRGCPPSWEVDTYGCGEDQVTYQYFKVTPVGIAHPVAALPKNLEKAENSPLSPMPNERHYTRISADTKMVEVTITDPDHFYPVLNLDSQGYLQHVKTNHINQ